MNWSDRILLSFSPTDHYTVLIACEGTLITGSPGSGKSSTSAKQIAHAFLRAGMGGLVLVAKAEETANWVQYAKDTGREGDLIIFSPESGHAFDAIYYEANRAGGTLESLIELFSNLLAIGKNSNSNNSGERYFELAVEEAMRAAIVLIRDSGERMSIGNINRVMQSLPSQIGQENEAEWQLNSYSGKLLNAIKQRQDSLTPDQWDDLENVFIYAFQKWPGLDVRTRSNVESTWSGMCNRFLYNPLSRIFNGGKCTIIPELTTCAAKIIVIDFPLLTWNETARLIACMIKLVFQRAYLRRDVTQYPTPAFIWQDEFQYFVNPKGRDNAFQQTCRSARIANVCVTQNILNLSEELGEQQPGSKTKSFLGNLALKIFHQQNDTDTNEYAANLIGKEYKHLKSSHISGTNLSVGKQEHLMHKVEPDEFTRLKKPSPSDPVSTAIVYQGGKTFHDGHNYLAVNFSR